MNHTPETIARFWAKVNKTDGCWLWTAHTVSGYGAGTANKEHFLAHRVSWELHFGPIPPGLFVCHHCDVRACVNPAHLFLGTATDNNHDMANKGRAKNGTRRGEASKKAKLTEMQVREIRTAYAAGGVTHRELGQRYGVDNSVISDAIRRMTWKHVED